MSALTFKLLDRTAHELDLSGLHPSALIGTALRALPTLRLALGREQVALADLFDISGDDYSTVRLVGLHQGCHRVGCGMTAGTLEIKGDVGNELGRELRGGSIQVSGNAGAGVGLGMRGGQIVIGGNAGSAVGGMIPGATAGMNGGIVIIGGAAGERAGERMRRGLIVIAGATGAHTGERMIAGTIAVLGQCGAHAGLGMRRGTLLLAQAPAAMAPTFNDCGEFELGIVTLLQRHLAVAHPALARKFGQFSHVRRWCGDISYGGIGEILIACPGT